MSRESDIQYAEERAKKITEALYRVTDLFSDREPLKWSLRSDALGILESVLMFKNPALKDQGGVLRQTEANMAKLLSLLDLAEAGSFISRLNFDVLKSEYQNLHKFLASPSYETADFLPAFFEKEGEKASASPEGEKRDIISESKPVLSKPENEQAKRITGSSIGHYIGQQYNYTPERERRAVILEYLKQQPGSWVSIGDLVAVFQHDLSEKTLQRDLARLAKEGILDKQGDKRWRRYTFRKEERGAEPAD